jgi:3-hydroxyisobutyrate dehydrogenase-like beta-hydroxyacid dehydrogenase
MGNRLGFIGFGEVGPCFSAALTRAGASVMAYDILLDNQVLSSETRERIQRSGAISSALSEVIEQSNYILSTVTNQTAKDVALSCKDFLRPEQVYLDLNSTSPSAKIEIAGIIGSGKAKFVEGAILGAVGATGSKTKILLGGPDAPEAAETLSRYGLIATAYSPEIGKASMFKMLRSIFSKGLENLLVELLISGKRAGIESDLWEDVNGFMASKPFDAIAENWIRTHATACDRRYHEMVQVLETMHEIGIDPIMTEATKEFFRRSRSLEFEEAFNKKPGSYQEVIDFMESQIRLPGKDT